MLGAALACCCCSLPGLGRGAEQGAVPAYAEEQTILQAGEGHARAGLARSIPAAPHRPALPRPSAARRRSRTVILQRGGNTWRTLRNGPISTISAAPSWC
jgi:formate dehydrogenase subunit gamma